MYIYTYKLQLSDTSQGGINNNKPFKVRPFKVKALTLLDVEKYVMTKVLKRDGDLCIITTKTGRIITIEKDSTYKARFNSGYKFNTNI